MHGCQPGGWTPTPSRTSLLHAATDLLHLTHDVPDRKEPLT